MVTSYLKSMRCDLLYCESIVRSRPAVIRSNILSMIFFLNASFHATVLRNETWSSIIVHKEQRKPIFWLPLAMSHNQYVSIVRYHPFATLHGLAPHNNA